MFRCLKEALVVLITPSSWPRVLEYDYAWDMEFRHILEKHGVKPYYEPYSLHKYDRYYVMIGEYKLWCANAPYYCFHRGGKLPSRYACIVASKKVKDLFAHLDAVAIMVYNQRPGEYKLIDNAAMDMLKETKLNTDILVGDLNKRVSKTTKRKRKSTKGESK